MVKTTQPPRLAARVATVIFRVFLIFTIFCEQACLGNLNALSAFDSKSSYKRRLISGVAKLKGSAGLLISAFPLPLFEPILIISVLAPAPFLTTKYRLMELSFKLREGKSIKYQKSSEKMVALQRPKETNE